MLEQLARELRQFNALGSSYFRTAAGRVGMTVTDMEVIDILDTAGPATAGQLADLTGLTTGAITGMLNRLEEAGVVRRERDPNDGRRVIISLEKEKDELRKINATFATLGKAWEDMAADYTDDQLAFLLQVLARSNALSRTEIVRLRETPSSEEELFSAPLGDLKSARLVVYAGVSGLTVRAGDTMSELYQASFQGAPPEVKVKDGVVSMRYSKRLWPLDREKRAAEVTLNTAIPWHIVVQGGASEISALLDGLDLAGLAVRGGMSTIHLELPKPSGVVPIEISGGASAIIVQRPAGVAVRAHLKGWVSTFVFDNQTLSNMGGDLRLQSADYTVDTPYYDIEVSSSASMVTITTG
jgi:DNA-binding MarR family transcriptional regulator